MSVDAFVARYVRPDEGTAVLICTLDECARTAAFIFAALVRSGATVDAFCFRETSAAAEETARTLLAELRARPNVRRVALVVCEGVEPHLRDMAAEAQAGDPERTPIFRVSGPAFGDGRAVGSA